MAVAVVVCLLGAVPLAEASGASTTGYAPFSSWASLVSRQHADLTAKAPTASQSSTWVSSLSAGTKTRGDLADALRRSPENLANVDPVVRVYRAFLGRAPDAGGLRFWIGRKRNVAPARTWSVTQIATEFTNGAEFQRKYGALTNRQFVTRIYTDVLERPADASGVGYWTGKLDRKEKTKAQVMVGFSESNEYKVKQAQNTDVAVAHTYLMGRAPTSAEAAAWVGRQKGGTPHRELLDELLASDAYAIHIAGATVPGAPTSVGAVAGNGQATVSWVAPTSDGGSAVTGYVVTPRIGGVAQAPVPSSGTATSTVVTGLANGTAYTFDVAAVNRIGTGARSSATAAVTPRPTVPGIPTAVAGVPADGRVQLSWAAPASTGGSPITGYVVTPYRGSTPQAAVATTSSATTVAVTGLTNEVPYTFAVAAVNAVGRGADSWRSSALVPTATTALAAGAAHACAIRSGTIRCVGGNGSGQLGNGTKASTLTPTSVVGITDAIALSAGPSHTCAVLRGGTVKCWGSNGYGVLGDGTTISRSTPVTVPGIAGATAIGTDQVTTCAIVTGGAVKCWGDNAYGTLGHGLEAGSLTPVDVVGVSGATALSVGPTHVCVIVAGGAVKCWGDNQVGQLGAVLPAPNFRTRTPVDVQGITGATRLALGAAFSCAVVQGGAVKCWGDDSRAQLGNGLAPGGSTPSSVVGLTGVTAVSAGFSGACAVHGGTVSCWGENGFGQLGSGDTHGTLTPVAVQGLADAADLATGNYFSCASRASGGIACWGDNGSGQLGDGTSSTATTPFATVGTADATEVAVGYGHSCALGAAGGVSCWGSNYLGRIGDGTDDNASTPVATGGITDATAIASGRLHSCAVVGGGSVRCWGSNELGQLGNGTGVDAWRPVPATGVTDAVALSAGHTHSCALRSGGAVSCWGSSGRGQLGSTVEVGKLSAVPVAVPGISGATKIASGDFSNCAIVAGGAVRCWGGNTSGQLGDGTTTSTAIPVAPIGISGATAIDAGGLTACAVVTGGLVKCWGSNANGQAGAGSAPEALTPVTVPGITGAVDVETGGEHSCATLADGSVRCWGDNSSGELGDGTTASSSTPVTVVGLTGATSVTASSFHTCAVVVGSGVRCWGAGAWGQLGDGRHGFAMVPLQVKGL
jgi:alpha-tubulin suppressor-like RCC1 family protein